MKNFTLTKTIFSLTVIFLGWKGPASVHATITPPVVGSGTAIVALDGTSYTGGSSALWDDLTANNNDFRNTTGNGHYFSRTAPTLIDIDGIPYVRFDGGDYLRDSSPGEGGVEGLYSPNPTDVTSFSALTFFAVTRNATDPLGLFDSGPERANVLRFFESNKVETHNNAPELTGVDLTNASDATVVSVTFLQNSGRSLAVYVDGMLIDSDVNASTAGITFRFSGIGAINGGANGFFTGDIGAILIYNGQLTDADRQTVETYLDNVFNPIFNPIIPEPTSLALALAGGLLMLHRRRRSA